MSLKSNKVFLPDHILSTNKYSLKDYKSNLNKKVFLKFLKILPPISTSLRQDKQHLQKGSKKLKISSCR